MQNSSRRSSNAELISISVICAIIMFIYSGGLEPVYNLGNSQEVEPLTFNYYLDDGGYINKVIIKEDGYTTVIDSKEYVISYQHIDNQEQFYELDGDSKTLRIYSPQYPSEQYRQ